jgi:hypothetical protein
LRPVRAGQKAFMLAFSPLVVASCQVGSRRRQAHVSATRVRCPWAPEGSRERQSDIMVRLGSDIPAKRKRNALDLDGLAFRFIVTVDIEGFSKRYAAEQAKAQVDLELAMARATESAGLERERWYRQPSGDGELAVLPQGVDGLSLVANYPRELAFSIANVNRANRAPRLRVRLAIHHGAVAPGHFGPVGTALIVISRLVDAEVTRQQLRQRSDLDIALIVSATVYGEVIQSRLHNLDPDAFRRVIIRSKGIPYVGYLCQTNLGLTEPELPVPPEPMLT